MSYKGKRVLVTGADGFIGSHVCDHLLREGAVVTALAQYNSYGDWGWAPAGAERQHGDIRDLPQMLRICYGQEIVFHLAALIEVPYSFQAPHSYIETNTTGTLNILEAARAAGAERFVLASTSAIYGSPSPYIASKLAAEELARSYHRPDFSAVSLRLFSPYGPRQTERAVVARTMAQVLDPTCDTIALGNLRPQRDFIYIDDVVGAFLAAGITPALQEYPYGIGTGVLTTIGEMVEIAQRAAGTSKPISSSASISLLIEQEAFSAYHEPFTITTDWTPTTTLHDGLTKITQHYQRTHAG